MNTYSLILSINALASFVKYNFFNKTTFLCYNLGMQMRQRFELKRLLAPQLQQSLKILTLPLMDLKAMVEEELNNNPFLEESQSKEELPKPVSSKKWDASTPSLSSQDGFAGYQHPDANLNKNAADLDFRLDQLTKKASLEDILLRQLGMFTNTDEELRIGQEIIGNIDENGYLKATTDEIAKVLNTTTDEVENVLKIIQQFEPAGVGARTVSECLLIQLETANEKDPLIRKIVESHLEDVAKKNYSQIAKALKEPLEKIEPLIKKILKLNPKPGRNYSTEEIQRVIPDIIVEEKGEDLEITINDEDIPSLNISKTYREMLKKDTLDPKTKEFLSDKLRIALELLRAISKRKATLRQVMETVLKVQQEAIKEDLSHLKPLTFNEVAQDLNLHESTICRVVMNKYVKTPNGLIALKDFFTSHVHDTNGQAISSTHVKGLIKEFIDQEDKKKPLSDQDISRLLAERNNLNVCRRTVAKYREELKILSTTYRRER